MTKDEVVAEFQPVVTFGVMRLMMMARASSDEVEAVDLWEQAVRLSMRHIREEKVQRLIDETRMSVLIGALSDPDDDEAEE